jgi:Mrp family chromosome partitioning ATPase
MTNRGIDVVSINLLLDTETTPVIWRGPVLGNVIKQFWSETLWNKIDYMFVDMPPGTGDVPLTVFQSLPLDGIIIVASPQELVGMIVGKAVNMAKMMNVPILGLVENMSYLECPDCGKHISVFGESHIDEIGAQYDLPVLAKLPIDPKLAAACDSGELEELETIYVDKIVELLTK